MTEHTQLVKHPRIWLEPAEDADPYTGQMWCQDNVWGAVATEYVLATERDALQARVEELEPYAREATMLVTGLAGGGSELFAKPIGDFYPADLPFCSARIHDRIDRVRRMGRRALLEKKAVSNV
jgi:hypothetical protein